MAPGLHGRPGHYTLLLVVAAALFLPGLGAPSLWDIDEGHNAEAAREMLESGNWIVPTFNFQLRVDKPALLYWLQMAAYRTFGINEFAARLPSAAAATFAVLLTYELGLFAFGATAGLLAGLILASATLFCGAAHFANPDALLTVFTLLTLLIFWRGFCRGDGRWFVPAAVAAGLAVMAKGPVGFVLPAAVVGMFLLLARRLGELRDRRLLLGLFIFGVVAFPWYIWVGVDTKADFLRGFFLTHNVNRFLSPMENHGGPVWYYPVVLLVGFAPWSAFLALTVWASVREWRTARSAPPSPLGEGGRTYRTYGSHRSYTSYSSLPPGEREEKAASVAHFHLFLWCWIAVTVAFFTVSSTKLPNYVLPVYPALALLTARLFDRWRRGDLALPAWPLPVGLSCLALVGVATALGLLVAGGAIRVPALRGRQLAGLESWAFLGLFPVAGALVAGWAVRRQLRTVAVAAVTAAALLFVGGLTVGGAMALDAHKAPRPLGDAVRAAPPGPEIRVGCFEYYQPSLVFYCRREVARFQSAEQALEFLRWPLPVYLFVPERTWEALRARARGPVRVLGRHYDLYRGYDVVVVTNGDTHSP